MKGKIIKEKVDLYKTPAIEVIEVEIKQNILQSASGTGSPRDMPGEIW